MIPIDKKIQAAARVTLYGQAWDKRAVEAALNPTPELPPSCINDEQLAAIKILHALGWGSHTIAQAMPVTEADIARVLKSDWRDNNQGNDWLRQRPSV